MPSDAPKRSSADSDQLLAESSEETATDSAAPAETTEYKFPNFVSVFIHSRAASNLSWAKGRPQSLLPAAPFGVLKLCYGDQAFTVTSEGCRNGEIRVNGVTHKGSAFSISPEKGVARVAGGGFPIEALLDRGSGD